MSLLRSQEVLLYEILIPKDNDWDIMNELGSINCLHFVDLNKGEQPHHLRYFSQVRRGEDAELMIQQLEDICRKYRVEMKQPANVDIFLQQVNQYTVEKKKAAHLLFNDIENDLIDKTAFLKQQEMGLERMIDMYQTILAKISVLQNVKRIFSQQDRYDMQSSSSPSNLETPLLMGSSKNELSSPLLGGGGTKLMYLGGTIKKAEQMTFKKLLFRATRGKAFAQFFSMDVQPEDILKGIKSHQTNLVYLIMFESGSFMRDSIYKVCSSTLEPVFEIDKSQVDRDFSGLIKQKDETKELIKITNSQLRKYLVDMNKMSGGEYSLIKIYKWYILKEKSIYIELNKLRDSEKILMGLFWCPTKLQIKLEERLDEIRARRNIEGPQIHLIKQYDEEIFVRPTYIEANEFTWPFQEIVNTYGIPQYQEINPAIFTIVTFPFLFGVMFGDIMHGIILIVFSSYLIFSKPHPGTITGQLYLIRYLLLLMGFFSFYCGFIYNDFSSIPIYLFGQSCYTSDHTTKEVTFKNDCTYQIGVDPMWYLAKNELTYMNSLKMKISVILGVAQMSLGVFMKAFNSIYFKRSIDFYFEFIPQIILLLVLFGFMDFMIIVKWLTNFEVVEGAKPPSIISQMIVMALNFGEQSDPNLRETPLFNNQTFIMRSLLIIAIITVPVMLLVKPFYENSQYNKHPAQTTMIDAEGHSKQYNAINDEPHTSFERHSNRDHETEQNHKGKHHHSFSDLFIHQLIETIEFVLGTVSNTASYLRLWALSLAHSQLAKVFFDNTLVQGFKSGSFLTLFLGFFVFLSFTVAVLMMMDLMEAFLHTLRLHWVEFQNKFYKGNGVKFQAFSIEAILKTAKLKDAEKQRRQQPQQ